MRFRFILAIIVAAALYVFAVAPSAAENEPPPAQPTPVAQPTPAPAPCIVPVKVHNRAAKRIYNGARVTKGEVRKLWRMRKCARSLKARASELRYKRAQSSARKVRLRMYCGSPTCNRRLLIWMADRRFGRGGGACLVPIISQESGFRHNINNGGRIGPPSGVAYGIPQALPPGKMASAGRDWATNPMTQIRWLLSYVRARFGGPCQALAYKRANGTY